MRLAILALLCASSLSAQTLNHTLTPGGVLSRDTAVICRPGYASAARAVPKWKKDSVYKLYHAVRVPHKCCEVDHLISLQLGGSNALQNLWPEPIADAARKDVVEGEAHRRVCDGSLPLDYVQTEIARDWKALRRRLFPPRPWKITSHR